MSTFRAKLLAIFGVALLALAAVLVVSTVMGLHQVRELTDVERRLVPKTELGPRMDAEFERLARAMQDAVAAQDEAALAHAAERRAALFELIAGAGAALEPSKAASLRWAIQEYYETAHTVSRRMIAGESSDGLLQEMARMQALQAKAASLIKRSTRVDRAELSSAFEGVRQLNTRADGVRLGITALGMLLVALLALWGGRRLLQSLTDLQDGLSRFGTGDFATPIPVVGSDELSSVAVQANQMAASLARLSEARELDAWLKAGLSGLAEQLRGELEPQVVAERALAFLAERVGAVAGVLYLRDDDGKLAPRAAFAGGKPASEAGAGATFEEGEGLVGQALRGGELVIIDQPPADYFKVRSGTGEGAPAQLALLPLLHFGQKAGVLELALFKPISQAGKDLLLGARAQLVITLSASRSAAARKLLLQQTQAQAEQLTAQEEELRLNNQELLAQQAELRRTNRELDGQRSELSQRNDELELARRGLTERADELKQMSAYKSQFLANMSHELRTPLNSMLLLSQLLAENDTGNLSSKQLEHLRTIHSAGQDLLTLINEVLDLSKIEAGKQDVALEQVGVEHFASFARRLFEASAAQKGLQLLIQLDAAAPAAVVTDRQRVERILLNLLSNALKFTERGSVQLRIGRPPSECAALVSDAGVAFSVTDTGLGIPEAARERVFAPFEQVQSELSRGHSGTGLGLSIARESARLLGGELRLLESSPAGSTFVCVLPERATRPNRAEPVAAAAKAVLDDADHLRPDEPYLLIIEDDAVLAEQLVDIARARGLQVVVVNSGRAGLAQARRGEVAGIILDVKLPDCDGWSVMERLKQERQTRSIPVHFVSGVDTPERGLALGAVGYLVKPASHAELARMIRALVPLHQERPQILIVEDDRDQGTSIASVLQQDGFQARHVQTGHDALQALSSERFGCLILDLGLPDMDGAELLRTLRSRPELGAPRVIVHTGRTLSRPETRELEAYAEAIVLKDGSSAERLLDEARLFVRHVTPALPANGAAPLLRPDVSLRGLKLLLAEDDMRTIYSLSALLRSKGADVVTAETGREALDALERHRDIHGVLMDIMMPEMDGYEAMRQLRKKPHFEKIPVIALTAKAMRGERERCLEAGASDYLPKPIDAEQLLSTLSGWLGSGVSA